MADPSTLIDFLSRVEQDRQRRIREAMTQPPAQDGLPKWAEGLDPAMFKGRTREMLTRMQSKAPQADMPDISLPMLTMPQGDTVNRAAKGDMLAMPQGTPPLPQPKPALPMEREAGTGRVALQQAPELPPEQNPAPAASGGQETASALQPGYHELSRHIGGPMGSYADIQRHMRQTGDTPDMRGMPQSGGGGSNRPPGNVSAASPEPISWREGQSPADVNASARRQMGNVSSYFGGGQESSGPGLGYIIGGIGAMLQEAAGRAGSVDAFVTRYQQHHAEQAAKAEELARRNKTVERAMDMGIDPDYLMTLYEAGDTKEIVKAIHEEQKFKREEGKDGAPKIVTLVSPNGRKQSIDVGQKEGRTLMQQLTAQGWLVDDKPSTQVNIGQSEYGTIPQGYEMVTDPETGARSMRPIPGGPAERELQEQAAQEQAGKEVQGTAAQTVFEDTERALGLVDEWGPMAAGSVAGVTDWLPEAPAGRLNNHIESIKGNVGIDSLLKIKASGAGLGHIPQAQLDMLASLLGRLSPRMAPDDLRYNLQRIQEIYVDIVRKTGGDPKEMYKERKERIGGPGEGTAQEDPLGIR